MLCKRSAIPRRRNPIAFQKDHQVPRLPSRPATQGRLLSLVRRQKCIGVRQHHRSCRYRCRHQWLGRSLPTGAILPPRVWTKCPRRLLRIGSTLDRRISHRNHALKPTHGRCPEGARLCKVRHRHGVLGHFRQSHSTTGVRTDGRSLRRFGGALDIDRIHAVAAKLGKDDILVTDANTGWLKHEAIRVCRGV